LWKGQEQQRQRIDLLKQAKQAEEGKTWKTILEMKN